MINYVAFANGVAGMTELAPVMEQASDQRERAELEETLSNWNMKPVCVESGPATAEVRIDDQPRHGVASRPAFDAGAALIRVDGDRAILRNMVGLFAMQWRTVWDAIARAGQRRDGATLELAASKLKVSVRSFGADDAIRVAQELEACGRHGNFHGVENACASLKMEVERLVSELQEFANAMGPGAV